MSAADKMTPRELFELGRDVEAARKLLDGVEARVFALRDTFPRSDDSPAAVHYDKVDHEMLRMLGTYRSLDRGTVPNVRKARGWIARVASSVDELEETLDLIEYCVSLRVAREQQPLRVVRPPTSLLN